ncbi:MAG: hypothetical protein IPN90_13265 [Elusimicrobia bacterium]|nr:hypothetical protein [Elusimicrobiota bacterium]
MQTEQSLTDSFSLAHFWRGAVGLFRAPKTLLRSMSQEGGYGYPILYALLWQYLAGAVGLGISSLRALPSPVGAGGKIFIFFVTPPIMLGVGFVLAALLFVIWHLMGSSKNYQTAFRVWALFAPLAVLNAVPYLSVAVIVFYFYLLVAASVEIHAIRPTKAWTVWGILLVVLALLLVMAGIVGAARGRLLSGQRGFSGPGNPSAAGFPGMPSPEIEKMRQAEMERAKAEFEKVQKDLRPLTSQKKAPEKK